MLGGQQGGSRDSYRRVEGGCLWVHRAGVGGGQGRQYDMWVRCAGGVCGSRQGPGR